jgi:hypothetical protein
MRPEFYEIYGDLYNTYPERLGGAESDTPYEIEEIIDSTIDRRDLSERVRPDARLFLLTNFHQLITLPLVYSGRSREEVFDRVSNDTLTILDRAVDVARLGAGEEDGYELSARTMLEAVHESWPQLQATMSLLWN